MSAYALVVGIGSYEDERIGKLNYTHADARAFAGLLLDPKKAALPESNVRLLLDREATLLNIKRSISGWLFQNATPDSTVLIFFAGHGHVEIDRGGGDGHLEYLLPWDADPENLFASSLSNVDFHRLLGTIKSDRLVVFMDACHSGGVADRGSRDIGLAHDPAAWLTEGEGRVVITAAKASQLSWEDDTIGHGVFTHHLLEALTGAADADGDGRVSVWEVYKYLERHVPQSARRLKNTVQEPFLSGALAKDIILSVDSELLARRLAEEREADRLRQTELAEKKRALFALNERGELPSAAFARALVLVDKNPEKMSVGEKKLARLVHLLAKGALAPSEYLELVEDMDDSGSGTRAPEPASSGSRAAERPTPAPAAPSPRFCTQCGAPKAPGTRFCIRCGA